MSEDIFAKLLAAENVDLRYGNYRTAAFDVLNRVMYLPIFNGDVSKSLALLMKAHEAGHAIYTPEDGWHEADSGIRNIPRSYINIVEDIRIEKKILRKYIGLSLSFKEGYRELMARDFFGIANRDPNAMPFIDRLNLKSKLRDLIDIHFSVEEQPYVDRAMAVEEFDDVIHVCQDIVDWQLGFTDRAFSYKESDALGKGSNTDQSMTNPDSEYEEFPSSNEEFIEDDDASGDSEDDESSDKEKASGTPASKREAPDELPESETDKYFRANEESLSVDPKNQPLISEGFTQEQIEDMYVPWQEVLETRHAAVRAGNEFNDKDPTGFFAKELAMFEENFKQFKIETTRNANTLAKEFEMRKAADRYRRSAESKSGILNMNKIHEYKYNDNLFLTNTIQGDSKSHGMIMYIDFSGSMHSIISNVIHQAIMLATFCRKVGIPFEVYSFTTGSRRIKERRTGEWKSPVQGYINTTDTLVVQQLSSSMKNSEFNDAVYHLSLFGHIETRDSYRFGYYHNEAIYDRLGSTPLNEVLLTGLVKIDAFKAKHKLQKVNLVVISDGDSNDINFSTSGRQYSPRQKGAMIRLNGRYVKFDGVHTSHIIDAFNKKGITTTSFFIIPAKNGVKRSIYEIVGRKNYSNFDKALTMARESLRKNNYWAKDGLNNFTRYFFIPGWVDAIDDEFEVVDNAKKSQITTAFKKYTKSKKSNRMMASSFAEIIK
jgi:hypothetical protein